MRAAVPIQGAATMVTLVFLLVVTAVFASILALEGGDERLERSPAGLLSWMIRGNWPAKVGGALMIIGVGALLRYALKHLDVPDLLKLGVGIGSALALGIASSMIAGNTRRRAISLALGGAAFGVAYLTAYSAFALFDYLPTMQGLGLLALTAVAAGVFAVSRGALSLAVLSMAGAFMAPAFAPDDPGPVVVYGYYVAISLLTLCMVALRGWRPLIHLSFLFTLAGSAFFAWTADYFSRGSAPQMLPLIAMLVAVHVAMPLLERRWQRGVVVERLDAVYMLALPVVAALTVLVMAPDRAALAVELWWFAGIWSAAAAWLFSRKREGAATHAVIGLLMLGLGLAARYRNLPWELVALAVTVCALVLAARRPAYERLVSFLAGLVLVLGAVHIIGALAPSRGDALFLNGRFFERLVGAGLLVIAALTLRRLRHTLDSMMLTVAMGWSAFAVGAEVSRLDLVSAWLLLHWGLALAAFALCAFGARLGAVARLSGPLVFALGLSVVFAQFNTGGTAAWISAIVAAAAMLAIALRPVAQDDGESSRLLGAIGVPVTVALWMGCYARGSADPHWQFPLAFAAAAALLVLLAGSRASERARSWFGAAVEIFAVGFTFVLAVATLFDIERVPSAAVLELLCIVALVFVARWNRQRDGGSAWVVPVLVIGIALVLQANLLRWLGPAGELDALSVTKMNWPTLVSLLWASIGAALTITARRAGSRMQWSAGAAFLVGAAIKLVLLDFGSLGQLANILAVIAAGGVFLLVGWLAPMPPGSEPASTPQAPATPSQAAEPGQRAEAAAGYAASTAAAGGSLELPQSYSQSRPQAAPRVISEPGSHRLGWAIAMAAVVLITLSQCRGHRPAFVNSPPSGGSNEALQIIEALPERMAPPESGTHEDVETAALAEDPLSGLLQEGAIIRASAADIEMWSEVAGLQEPYLRIVDYPATREAGEVRLRVFLVQSEIEFPEGLQGQYRATFLVPENVSMPGGDPGESLIIT